MVINNWNSFPQLKNNELRSLLLHELMHGLGFISNLSLLKLDNDTTDVDVEKYIADPMIYEEGDVYAIFTNPILNFSDHLKDINDITEYIDQLKQTEITQFYPLSIFDKNFVSLETGERLFDRLPFFYEEINQKCLPNDGTSMLYTKLTNKFGKDCIEKLGKETQDGVTSIAKNYFFKANTIGILTTDGEIVPIQTVDGVFFPGSSINHPRSTYVEKFYFDLYKQNYTEEVVATFDMEEVAKGLLALNKETIAKYYDGNFMLYMSDIDNLTVEEMLETVAKDNKYGLIGDGIFKVMTTLGWTEKGEPRIEEVFTVDESLYIPEAKAFENLMMRKFDLLMNQDTEIDLPATTVTIPEEEKPTSVLNEVETPLPDDTELEIEIEDSIMDTPMEESDSDSDIEEQS